MWVEIAPQIPSEIAALGATVSTGLGTVRTALEALRLTIQATTSATAALETGLTNRVNAAVGLLIDAVNAAITNLLDSTGLYFLLVPLPKKGLARLVSDAVDTSWTERAQSRSEAGSNLVDFPARSVIDSADAATRARLERSRIFEQIFSANDLFHGGNTHFVKTVAEALFDGKDVNRPRFEAGSQWSYGVFVAGASDAASILQSASFFERLFNGSPSANDVGASRGITHLVPRGVAVAPGLRGAPVITWELVPASKVLSSYDNSRVVATKYAIIRSTHMRARAATKVLELFSTRKLVAGLEGSHGAKVLAVRDYDGIVTRFVDDSPLDADKTYYYHVAFATKVVPSLPDTPGDPTTSNVTRVPSSDVYDFGFDLLSGGQAYRKPSRATDYGASALGTAPDWRRTPSAANLIPGLDRYLGLVQEYLRSLQSASNNIAAQNQSTVELLTRQIDRYAAFSAEFERRLQSLNSVFETPVAGSYATFRSGSGPVSAFLSDLVSAFEDTSDDNRPPFDNGDEFTTGAIVLAVGPDALPIQAAFSLLLSIFTPQNSEDPALEGIRSVEGELDALETQLAAELTNATVPSLTFNSDMSPREPGAGDASCD